MNYSSGRLRVSTVFAPCGSVSGFLRPSKCFLCASYCGVSECDGVFAHRGRTSSTLPLPEQAASTVPKSQNMTRRIIMSGLQELRCARNRGKLGPRTANFMDANQPSAGFGLHGPPQSTTNERRREYSRYADSGRDCTEIKLITCVRRVRWYRQLGHESLKLGFGQVGGVRYRGLGVWADGDEACAD